MPQPRGGLGRGLDALIPAGAAAPASEVPIDSIRPNPRQPRRRIQSEGLEELASSLREVGIIQPLVVAAVPDAPGAYQLIAGERRWQAARLAGLERVPVVVREATPKDLLLLALVENIQRADLDPLEEATAFRHLIDEMGLTQDQVADRVGKSRTAISNTLRLLQLSDPVKAALLANEISEGHARALLPLPAERQLRALDTVLARNLSVRQTEELVRRRRDEAEPAERAERARGRDAETARLEEELRKALGTKVELYRSRKGGRVVIHFFSEEELQGLYDLLVR
jgi:ParB family chromosome partitioning protein